MCKIFGPKIRSCKIFDKFQVCPEQRKSSDRVSIIRPVDKVSPNPICHPSSLWIYLFAEYRKSTRQVKGVVLYTLQLQKWREQWWLITTVCEWGKEKLQIWSWGSLSTFKWWLYKYSWGILVKLAICVVPGHWKSKSSIWIKKIIFFCFFMFLYPI